MARRCTTCVFLLHTVAGITSAHSESFSNTGYCDTRLHSGDTVTVCNVQGPHLSPTPYPVSLLQSLLLNILVNHHHTPYLITRPHIQNLHRTSTSLHYQRNHQVRNQKTLIISSSIPIYHHHLSQAAPNPHYLSQSWHTLAMISLNFSRW